MQDLASQPPRIGLLGTSVNKGKKGKARAVRPQPSQPLLRCDCVSVYGPTRHGRWDRRCDRGGSGLVVYCCRIAATAPGASRGLFCFSAICRRKGGEPPRTRTWNLEIKRTLHPHRSVLAGPEEPRI